MTKIESVFSEFQSLISAKAKSICQADPDPTHDFLHVTRVVTTAKKLAQQENANLDVVLPAAYLHDFVLIPKNDPRRSIASKISADAAIIFLKEIGYPENLLPAIHHAIHAHSFSANIASESLEASVVQDADRLDGLGYIGIIRCFGLGTAMGRSFYDNQDPFCRNRQPDDAKYSVDHFYRKLLVVAKTLKTASAQSEGKKRLQTLENFLQGLEREITS